MLARRSSPALAALLGVALLVGGIPPALAASTPQGDIPAAATPGADTPAAAPAAVASTARRAAPARITDLGRTLCVQEVPLGLVRLAGPAGTQILAQSSRSGSGRLLTIKGGSGTIGGLTLTGRDFGGHLTYRDGSFAGSVTIDLARHARIVPGWEQQTQVTAIPSRCRWASVVRLHTATRGGAIDLRGSVRADGSYVLNGTGAVSFAGTRVPLRGWLSSAGEHRGAAWHLAGTGAMGTVKGARILQPRIDMTQDRPGIWGTATVALAAPALLAPARLRVQGPLDWRVFVDGSDEPFWSMPGDSGIRVGTGQLGGSMGVANGEEFWALTAPAAGRIEDMHLGLRVKWTGPAQYDVSTTGGRGSILGMDQELLFTRGPGTLHMSARGISGSLSVTTTGATLLDLPSRWRAATQFSFIPPSPRGWSFRHTLTHTLTNLRSIIRLTGQADDSGGVQLTATGRLAMGEGMVPVSGYYRRANFDDSTVPQWQVAARPGDAPGGRVPVGGGAAIVGGAIYLNGPGSVPPPAPAGPTLAASSAPASSGFGSPPGPPKNVAATVLDEHSVSVSWTPGSNGGSSIKKYEVRSSPTTTTCTVGASPCVMGGLASGTTYTFQVRANNSEGWSNWSSSTEPVTTRGGAAFTGSLRLALTDTNDFTLPINYTWWSDDEWTITAAGVDATNVFDPFDGLAIPETAFHGTITASAGNEVWDVHTDTITWTDIARDLDLRAGFQLSDGCLLAGNCPGSDGVYFTAFSSLLFDDVALPDTDAMGSFLADASWARWDAATADVSFEGITLTGADLTIWAGPRAPENANLAMPDLSSYNGNGMGVEFCGTFTVPIPDVQTLRSYGCAEWSSAGIVMGQTATGGGITPTKHNGVSLSSIEVNGFALSTLPAQDDVSILLNGASLDLERGKNYITAAVVVPGTLMTDFGVPSTGSPTFTATGWFTTAGEFSLDVSIPVHLSGSGITLNEILVHVGKEDGVFTLYLDAETEVNISGTQFPLHAYIGYKNEGDKTVTVGFTATGSRSAQPDGLMDFVNLLPEGTFEPDEGTLIDGSFDAKGGDTAVRDGGFEQLSDPGELMGDGTFEAEGVANLLSNPDFEDGSTGNLLPNGDFEDANLLANGDFEEDGSAYTWGSGAVPHWNLMDLAASAVVATGTATGAPESGSYILTLSTTNTAYGYQQYIPGGAPGATVTMSLWATYLTGSPVQAQLDVTLAGTGCNLSTTQSVALKQNDWTPLSFNATIPSGCTGLTVKLIPHTTGVTIGIDAAALRVTSTSSAINVPNLWRPHLVDTFDSLATSSLMPGYSSGVSVTSDGTLSADGSQYWTLFDGTTGYANGDFDVTYRIKFEKGTNSTDKSCFGFWLQGNSPTSMHGYCFQLAASSSSTKYGGFVYWDADGWHNVSSGSGAANLQRGEWYEVHLRSWGSGLVTAQVAATVTKLSDNSTPVFKQVFITGGSSGYFGGLGGLGSTGYGVYWDDISIRSVGADSPTSVKAPAKVWLDAGRAHSGIGSASLSTTSWTGVPFGYATNIVPAVGSTYTYTAWLRASSGTVNGTLGIVAPGGTVEKSAASFQAGTSWTKVTSTLTVTGSGHTDLQPTIVINSGNAELRVDDQVFQQVPWTVPAQVSGSTRGLLEEVLPVSGAHSGSDALQLRALSTTTTSTVFSGKPAAPNATYTFTAWVKSPDGVTGSIKLLSTAGTNSQPFTGNGTWQKVTVNHVGSGGSAALQATVTLDAGFDGKFVSFDDVSLTATGLDSYQTSYAGSPAPAAGWVAQKKCSTCSWVDDSASVAQDATKAHGGNVSMIMTGSSSNQLRRAFTTTTTPRVGSIWHASMWFKTTGTTPSLTVNLLCPSGDGTSTVATTSFTLSSTSYVSKDLTGTATTCTGPLTLEVNYPTDSAGRSVYLDDISLTQSGLDPRDDWSIWTSSGYLQLEGKKDAGKAHSGTGYLELTSQSTQPTYPYVQVDYTPEQPQVRTAAAWVRSGTSSSFSAAMTLITVRADGTHVEELSTPVSVTSNWSLVYVTLPVTQTAVVGLRTQFTVPASAVMLVDDIDSRSIADWKPTTSAPGTMTVIQNAEDPVDGSNVLRMSATANGGVQATASGLSVPAGSTYRLRGYAKQAGSTSVKGLATVRPDSGPSRQVGFTAGSTWQPFELEIAPNGGVTQLTVSITLSGTGEILLDALTLEPYDIVQDDPWTTTNAAVTAHVREDPALAHGGSYGGMSVSTTIAGQGVFHDLAIDGDKDDVFNVNAWVRSVSGGSFTGKVHVETTDGTAQSWEVPFAATGDWSNVALRMPLSAPHAGLRVTVTMDSTAGVLAVDDVVIQENPWVMSTTGGGSGTQTVVYDSASAQSGSSYLRIQTKNATTGTVSYDMKPPSGMGSTFRAGTTYTFKVFLRSPTQQAVNVTLTAGSGTSTFGFSSKEWTAKKVSVTPTADTGTIRLGVGISPSGVPLDIDSGELSYSDDTVDGIHQALQHPEWGYNYLWNEAFGIPGAHLWALSGQVQYVNGLPGIGVAATLYQDPTKAPTVMKGTQWIKGDMQVNVSEADPCFRFSFVAPPGSDSSVYIAHGVFDSPAFSIAFAPRGCQVGPYVLPKGASLSFDDSLGDGSLHLALAITEGDHGPEFSEEVAISDISIGGTHFQDVELDISLTSTTADISFNGDMTLAMGDFHGDLALTADDTGVWLKGDVGVTDWKWKGGDFDVEEFTFGLVMQVPAAGVCGSFGANTTGKLDAAKKTSISFIGRLDTDCGQIKVLHFQYEYSHGGISQTFLIDYDATTRILAGGVGFDFERRTTWNFFGYKYERHPEFSVEISFSMDVTSPASTAQATIIGQVSVSGGSGRLECHLYADKEDSCSIRVELTVGGGHVFTDTW